MTRGPEPNQLTTWDSDSNPSHNPNRPTGWGNYLKTGTNPHS